MEMRIFLGSDEIHPKHDHDNGPKMVFNGFTMVDCDRLSSHLSLQEIMSSDNIL